MIIGGSDQLINLSMKKKNKATKKWRRINPYICDKCHKRRLSFFFQRAEAKICAKCSKDEVPNNQPSLFNA